MGSANGGAGRARPMPRHCRYNYNNIFKLLYGVRADATAATSVIAITAAGAVRGCWRLPVFSALAVDTFAPAGRRTGVPSDRRQDAQPSGARIGEGRCSGLSTGPVTLRSVDGPDPGTGG